MYGRPCIEVTPATVSRPDSYATQSAEVTLGVPVTYVRFRRCLAALSEEATAAEAPQKLPG
jgi:hypothetical protein